MADVKSLQQPSDVAIVVVNYRTPELTIRCVRSLQTERELLPTLRVVVVDGGSADSSAEILREQFSAVEFHGWVQLVCLPINGGFGWANNQAIIGLLMGSEAPDFIHLLNPDTVVEPGAVLALLRQLQADPRAGAVGSQLLELDGSPAGSAFPFPTIVGEFARGARTGFIDRLLRLPEPAVGPVRDPRPADWVTGASVMIRSAALRETGLFDDGFFLYHEEVELMWRIRRRGWSIYLQPASRVIHVGGASTGVHSRVVEERVARRKPAYWYQSRRRFFARTRGVYAARAAWLAWIVGHCFWRLRGWIGVNGASKPVADELRDWVVHAFPRRSDCDSPNLAYDVLPGRLPGWMESQ